MSVSDLAKAGLKKRYIELLEECVNRLRPILEKVDPSKQNRNYVGVYLRVSQRDENVANQLLEIQKYVAEKGYLILVTKPDIDVSGTVPPWQRDKFLEFLQDCVTSNVGKLIFWDLSRFARSVEWGMITLLALLDFFDVEFVSMRFLEYVQDRMMKKKLILDFLWFAELYVEDIKRRTRTAMERLKAEGRLYHRPPTPIPCDLIKLRLEEGMSLRKIYQWLVKQGYLRYKEKNVVKIMSYQWFLKRVKRECIES